MKRFIGVALSLALLGCSSQKGEAPSSSVQGATALDAGNYNQAIEQLSEALYRNPNDQRVRVQLASAYAGRAGLPLASFLALGRELANTTRDVDRLFEQKFVAMMSTIKKNLKGKTELDTLQVIEQVYIGSLRLATILRQFEAVPVVKTRMQFEDVNQAVAVLAGDQSLVRGGALYRALLRVAALRYRIENDIDRIKIKRCQADLAVINRFVDSMYQESRAVLVDLGMATLDQRQREQWRVAVVRLDQGVEQLVARLGQLSSAGVIDVSDVVRMFNGRCQ